MPSTDICVQVSLTPQDRLSGQISGDIQLVVVEVPGERIEKYRIEESAYAGKATDEQLAEFLARKIDPSVLVSRGIYLPGPSRIDAVAVPERPPAIEGRRPDFIYDGMKASII